MRKKKEHPCSRWCAGQILGIVENLKLRGEIDEDFQVEIRSMTGLMWVPGGSLKMTCEHRREYLVSPKP